MQQTQQNEHNSSTFTASNMSDARVRTISSILNICERTTMNMERDGIGNMVKAIIIISMKFVDKEALFKAVLPDMYIDWDYLRNQQVVSSAAPAQTSSSQQSSSSAARKNLIGDASIWMNLVQFMDFGGTLDLPLPVLQTRYPPLFCLHSAIQASGAAATSFAAGSKSAQAGGSLSFDDACKMLILSNIEGLASKTMMELHTAARLNRNTHSICEGIVSRLADERHGADVYEETFKYVLGSLIRVDEKALAQHIAHYKQTKQARDRAWVLKAVQSKICRPSMREVAASMTSLHRGGAGLDPATGAAAAAATTPTSASFSCSSAVGPILMGGGSESHDGGSGVSCITFEQHLSLVRYPNSMSNLRRLRCYLLACQGHHFDYQRQLETLVQKDVAKTLAENPVPIPDVNSVVMGIDSLSMNIRPFDELNQFRTKCFLSFASHQKRGLSLTQVLKLYVAAYQAKPIWKQVWTRIYPVISPQIIRDVETFAATTPFAVQPFMEILKTSSPF